VHGQILTIRPFNTTNFMNKLSASFAAVAALLLLCSTNAGAGNLTIDPGQPTFTPNGAFSNNSITAQVVGGNQLQIFGNTNIAVTPGGQAVIGVTGNFSANMGDFVSLFYNFSIDLNSSVPVTVTIAGTANTAFGPVSASDSFVLGQGFHQYSGMNQSAAAPIPLSGSYSATMTFDFGNPTTLRHVEGLGPNSLSMSIPQNGLAFQLAPTAVPEPSTFALAAFALGGLFVALKRRRLA
jgi:PEP-CTERM motif-containing protein